MVVESDVQAVSQLNQAYEKITSEVAKAIVGQDLVIEQLLIALFARGHCLLVGVPGLAKTLIIRTLASCLSLKFSRIQFTPDLMPADITGTEVIQEDKMTGDRSLHFLQGPIFANVVLADEINRTSPKTQAALLEAMQEHQVTVGGASFPLPEPFFVLATQNPIEQEGTYPLPEAQLDRFMLNVLVDYPDEEEELEIVKRTTSPVTYEATQVLSSEEIISLGHVVRKIPAADHILRFALAVARMTRPSDKASPEVVKKYVSWGAGPRASQYLVLAAKARAALHGRPLVTTDDIRMVGPAVLRHRIVTNFNAEADGIRIEKLVCELLDLAESNMDSNPSADHPKLFRS